MRRILLALFSVLAVAAPAAFPAAAQVEVDINAANTRAAIPIAIPTFTNGSPDRPIAAVVAADLERTGLFAPLDEATFRERNLDVNAQPNFEAWRALAAQALVNGQITTDADGRMRADFRLWDVNGGQQLLGLQYTSTPDNWRRVAHQIADRIYERLTGQRGYFDTRVVFVAPSGPRTNRVFRLGIMDQDGGAPSFINIPPADVVMSPRFSASGEEITYMAIRNGRSRIYVLNLNTSRNEVLGEFQGMAMAPRFSPDGRRVAFAVERNGNADVWVMNLADRSTRRITADPSIDTSPSFSPDGSRIVFTSDRGGSPQLYVMNVDGSGVRRVSAGRGLYSAPAWSPTGDLIAFTRQNGGQFHIGVMRPDGGGERLLTSSFLDEGPSWSPNGRVIMFAREQRGGNPRLFQVDVTGRNERATPYPGAATDPAWSPNPR